MGYDLKKMMEGRGLINSHPEKVITLHNMLRPDIIPLMALSAVAIVGTIAYCVRNVTKKRDLIVTSKDKQLPRYYRYEVSTPQKFLVINRYGLKPNMELEKLRREIYDPELFADKLAHE